MTTEKRQVILEKINYLATMAADCFMKRDYAGEKFYNIRLEGLYEAIRLIQGSEELDNIMIEYKKKYMPSVM